MLFHVQPKSSSPRRLVVMHLRGKSPSRAVPEHLEVSDVFSPQQFYCSTLLVVVVVVVVLLVVVVVVVVVPW